MSYANNPYQSFGMPVVAQTDENTRAAFIRRTYLHLLGAVVAFIVLEAFLLSIPGIGEIVGSVVGSRFGWFIVLAAYMGVSYIANSWALNATSLKTQYMGLGLFVVAEAIIFVPLLFIAQHFHAEAIPKAGLATLLIFGGLTAGVFISKKDFSFLGSFLTMVSFGVLAFFLISALIGGPVMGTAMIIGMIVLMSGWILYDTSNVMLHYRTDQYVAASLALFASVATLFWYVLQLFMSRD